MAPVCHRHAACRRRKADEARAQASLLQRRPRVFLEEWDEPLISGIGSVSDLIAIAGGDLPGVGEGLIGEGADRDPEQVVERWPDIIIGSGVRQVVRPGEGSGSMPAQWRPSGLTSR